jgi:multiple sugar transport system permease protein
MTTATLAAKAKAAGISEEAFRRWQARRRWSRAALVYAVMLFFGILLVGPLLFATVSSLKSDPLEYPPSLNIAQLDPRNWAAAARLGVAGARDRWFGGFAPGAVVPFEVRYFVPDGVEAAPPEVVVPRRRPGAGLGAVLRIDFAADYASVSDVRLVESQAGTVLDADGEAVPGTFLTYGFEITYEGEGPEVQRLPLDVTASPGVRFVGSTLAPTRMERRGRTASFDDVAPGVLGYVFHNYVRVFNEVRSPSTGQSLFLNWILNSFSYAFFRIVTSIAIATMAGYALARLRFRGRELIFILVLFAQMIPDQVLFISNYLVLRDGLIDFGGFKLSALWGQPGGLLNSMTGLVFISALQTATVFMMKQFFETLPREVEEAASIDGASHWQRFSRVVLPMARPALGAVVVLQFQGAWNEFFWSFVILTSPEQVKTLPIGLLSFRNTYGGIGDWGLILSGAVLSALPVIVLFFVFQRYFLEGVSFGGGKE